MSNSAHGIQQVSEGHILKASPPSLRSFFKSCRGLFVEAMVCKVSTVYLIAGVIAAKETLPS